MSVYFCQLESHQQHHLFQEMRSNKYGTSTVETVQHVLIHNMEPSKRVFDPNPWYQVYSHFSGLCSMFALNDMRVVQCLLPQKTQSNKVVKCTLTLSCSHVMTQIHIRADPQCTLGPRHTTASLHRHVATHTGKSTHPPENGRPHTHPGLWGGQGES